MQNEKLITVYHTILGIYERLPKSIAEEQIALGVYKRSSKSRYKKYLKDKKKENTPKIISKPNPLKHRNNKGMPFKGNNRKSTSGRKVVHQPINIKWVHEIGNKLFRKKRPVPIEGAVKYQEKTRGFIKHRAIEHGRIDPRTGSILIVKEGKGKEEEFVETMMAGEPKPFKVRTIKNWINRRYK